MQAQDTCEERHNAHLVQSIYILVENLLAKIYGRQEVGRCGYHPGNKEEKFAQVEIHIM